MYGQKKKPRTRDIPAFTYAPPDTPPAHLAYPLRPCPSSRLDSPNSEPRFDLPTAPADEMACFTVPASISPCRSPSPTHSIETSYEVPSVSGSPTPMTSERATSTPLSRACSIVSEESDGSHRSDSYWFDDGSIVLKVNATVYNVHKSLLRLHSEYFKNITSEAIGSAGNPLILDYRNDDFETFLSIIYPSTHGSSPDFSANQWLAVLSVATELKFKAIRNTAIANLTDVLDEIDRIRFGRVHGVWDWLTVPYRILSEREEPLTLEEGIRLGMEDVIEIARKRELLARGACWEDLAAIA